MRIRMSCQELLVKTKLIGVYCLFAPRTFGYGIDIGFWQTLDGWKWKIGFMHRGF